MNLSDLPPIPPGGFYAGVVMHWTAGRYLTAFPTDPDVAAAAHGYHISVLGPPREGELVLSYPFQRNLRKIPAGGAYAAHTLRRNSGRIGIACCSMYRATMQHYGQYPTTQRMFEAMCAAAAVCVVRWGLHLSLRSQVTTHYQHAKADGYYPDRWDWKFETDRAIKVTAYYVKELSGFIP